MKNVYIWHNQSSEESAVVLKNDLTAALGAGYSVKTGKLPPRDFSGILIGWGAKPSDRFKWEDRNFHAIFNDPRKVRQYIDRLRLSERLAATVNPTMLKVVDITNKTYEQVCAALNLHPASGTFYVSKESGGNGRIVHNAIEYNAAKAEGFCRAMPKGFANPKRFRYYTMKEGPQHTVFHVGVKQELTGNPGAVADEVARRLGWAGQATDHRAAIRAAVAGGLLNPADNMVTGWTSHPGYAANRNIAQQVTQVLELDFAAVDFNVTGETLTLLNVMTTPNISTEDATEVRGQLVSRLVTWVQSNTLSAKEMLRQLTEDVNDEEAEAMLGVLRNVAGNGAAGG